MSWCRLTGQFTTSTDQINNKTNVTISEWILHFRTLWCLKIGREQFSFERKLSSTKELSRTVYYGVTIFHEIHVSTTISKADYFFWDKLWSEFWEGSRFLWVQAVLCKRLSRTFFHLLRIFHQIYAQFKFSFWGFFVWSGPN